MFMLVRNCFFSLYSLLISDTSKLNSSCWIRVDLDAAEGKVLLFSDLFYTSNKWYSRSICCAAVRIAAEPAVYSQDSGWLHNGEIDKSWTEEGPQLRRVKHEPVLLAQPFLIVWATTGGNRAQVLTFTGYGWFERAETLVARMTAGRFSTRKSEKKKKHLCLHKRRSDLVDNRAEIEIVDVCSCRVHLPQGLRWFGVDIRGNSPGVPTYLGSHWAT